MLVGAGGTPKPLTLTILTVPGGGQMVSFSDFSFCLFSFMVLITVWNSLFGVWAEKCILFGLKFVFVFFAQKEELEEHCSS